MIGVLLAVGACGPTNEPMQQSESGYDAIRFRQMTELRDHLVNTWTFDAGSTFIADRRSSWGPVYCGTASLNGTAMPACFGVIEPSTLVIGPGWGFKEVHRPLAPGTFEKIKVKL